MSNFDENNDSNQPLLGQIRRTQASLTSDYARWRSQTRGVLASNAKHYLVLGLVALDVGCILADIFIALIACDLQLKGEEWVDRTREALHVVALVFSSLFLAELLVSVWAYGRRFFSDWFHCFDGFIILASFIIDVLTRGILEEIGSLIIILRLWRFVKIVEELSLGASERMEEIEGRVVDLERENLDLKAQVETMREEGSWRG
ncbi:hypothetical protein QBC47DRAFT_87364 [Echria macrotheca]|uniref:Voltage-gated hydrogen channel 1 n=1 Tax=Echria macrotheca TaxID=438768 RepID=A0AAJ0F153_9PEZI|nr:hypothetical protein QBC47DRAFT_87364 [Echria macrotheca]